MHQTEFHKLQYSKNLRKYYDFTWLSMLTSKALIYLIFYTVINYLFLKCVFVDNNAHETECVQVYVCICLRIYTGPALRGARLPTLEA